MIRGARSADATAIAELWNGMIRDTLDTFTTQEKTVATVEALIKERPGAFFVAADPGAVSGFATFGPFRAGPGYAMTCEHSIIVAAHAQRTGVGTALMRRLEDAARDQGQHVMIAAISGANPRAVKFHTGLGFGRVGHLPEAGRKSDQWLDLVLMQKIIGARG